MNVAVTERRYPTPGALVCTSLAFGNGICRRSSGQAVTGHGRPRLEIDILLVLYLRHDLMRSASLQGLGSFHRLRKQRGKKFRICYDLHRPASASLVGLYVRYVDLTFGCTQKPPL